MKKYKYLAGPRRLGADEVTFADEIAQIDNLLEFYIPVTFDADAVFGTNVCNADTDDWLNIYAYYDMERREVSRYLDVYIGFADGSEKDCKYRLSDDERGFLLPKMEAFIASQLGISLDDACKQYQEEA